MKTRLCAVAIALCAGTPAFAGTLQLDINSFTATLSPDSTGFRPFPMTPVANATPTGTINFSLDATTSVRLLIDGNTNHLAPGYTLSSLTGSLTLASGVATAGTLSLSVTNGVTTNTYSAQVLGGTTSFIPGQGYGVLGTFWQGFFSDSSFGGVDIQPFFAAQGADGLRGTYMNFKFLPSAAGIDADTDLDVFMAIPLPGPGAMALVSGAGLAGISSLRRRRST